MKWFIVCDLVVITLSVKERVSTVPGNPEQMPTKRE